MASTVELDGRILEGGGQIVRIALAVSALIGIPIRITNVRGNRAGGGGLKNQHLAAVNFLATVCGATVTGAQLKSKTLEFKPNSDAAVKLETCSGPGVSDQAQRLEYTIDQKTDGSVALVLQAILPFLLFGSRSASGSENGQSAGSRQPLTVKITGGLNGTVCPSQDYINEVLFPTLARIGLPSVTTVGEHRHSNDDTEPGWVQYHITPLDRGAILPCFTFAGRGKIKRAKAIIRGPSSVTNRVRDELKSRLESHAEQNPDDFERRSLGIEIQTAGARRLYIFLVAISSNGYRLGCDMQLNPRKGDAFGQTKVTNFVERITAQLFAEIEHGGCVDTHMQDQLVIFQALAKGRSPVYGGNKEPSLHTKTARWVVQEMLGVQFEELNGSWEGVGLVAGETFSDRELTAVEDGVRDISI